MALRLGISPCPNDAFLAHAWVHGLLPSAPEVAVELADIDVLNQRAEHGDLDVVKVSYAALPWLLEEYVLLPSGGAVGRGCGPLVLTRDAGADLTAARVAVPGLRTTAFLLMRLWRPGLTDVVVLPYDQIMPAVVAGDVDAGLVIHESRFTYPDYGLHALVDLGAWWESDTGLPIPLGAIVARRSLGEAMLDAVTAALRASVEHAWAHPEDSAEWVRENAQELSPEVTAAHIALYVTEFSRDLGEEGRAAVRALLGQASSAGLVPEVSL